MNKTNLKRYAPQARKDFIAAVTARAQLLGLSEQGGRVQAEPCTVAGDVAMIAGRPWPASVQGQRDQLLQRMQRDGFGAALEAVAYTWFNRLAALRFMELHDYLGHGRRVLSNPEGARLPPEVLAHALELTEAGSLPGLRVDKVRELKLGNQDGELYRRSLIAQCNALHSAMPFLFEHIDDETELLLPDNLLLSDSIVAKLVAEIPEEDWAEVEVVGWLYQFYISEKKDEVIGKVVKSEDIPAATQLFTPNWIVQYLVQNSVGRLWLMANLGSTLASQWPYYIQPAEQTPEVQAQLDALIQTRMGEDGGSLNPETITVLDPACGSGHILVVAYDVLMAIYLERGYQPRAIPRLILEKNLYGLDIDDRAAQLAGFALLMKARADDRRLFAEPPKLNVLSLQESKGLSLDEVATHLAPLGIERAPLKALLDTFEHAKTFGSLIQIPPALNGQLLAITQGLQQALQDGDLYARHAAKDLLPQVSQALALAMHFDAVVANPPYLGGKGMNAGVKEYAKVAFPDSKADLFAMFIERGFTWCKPTGFNTMVTMQAWMFLSSFEVMRQKILENRLLCSLVQIGYNSFPEMNSKIAQACAFSIGAKSIEGYQGSYLNLNCDDQSADKSEVFLNRDHLINFVQTQDAFSSIPGSPLAYWMNEATQAIFKSSTLLGAIASPRAGLATGDNNIFQRQWHEVSLARVGFEYASSEDASKSNCKWFPCNSGGPFRKWYGNHEMIVNWENDGAEIRNFRDASGKQKSRPQNTHFFFKPGVTWTKLSTGTFAARYRESGFVFDDTGRSAFPDNNHLITPLLALLCSNSAGYFLSLLNASLSFTSGDIARIPIPEDFDSFESKSASEAVEISRLDWDHSEVSWNFAGLFRDWHQESEYLVKDSWSRWGERCLSNAKRLKQVEEENNRLFIEAYGLQDELSPEVPEDQITLARADREKDCRRLISYAIGCMMGRYSLNEPGLIYAHAGNVGFDLNRYTTFPADADGIVPITDERWFQDDAASRVREFLLAIWGAETLEENMAWLAESLGTKGGRSLDLRPDETIRRYLADRFFKDHLQTYKKRPIYWLFSSGKQGAFQALVYLHRYHEGTLARMRSEYLLPLTSKMQSRIESLQADILAASSTAARTKLTKQLEALRKQHLELLAYDEKLRHHADQRITLDLDDGVKVNYGRFGDLLAEVKAVTGGTQD